MEIEYDGIRSGWWIVGYFCTNCLNHYDKDCMLCLGKGVVSARLKCLCCGCRRNEETQFTDFMA